MLNTYSQNVTRHKHKIYLSWKIHLVKKRLQNNNYYDFRTNFCMRKDLTKRGIIEPCRVASGSHKIILCYILVFKLLHLTVRILRSKEQSFLLKITCTEIFTLSFPSSHMSVSVQGLYSLLLVQTFHLTLYILDF